MSEACLLCTNHNLNIRLRGLDRVHAAAQPGEVREKYVRGTVDRGDGSGEKWTSGDADVGVSVVKSLQQLLFLLGIGVIKVLFCRMQVSFARALWGPNEIMLLTETGDIGPGDHECVVGVYEISVPFLLRV